MRPIITLLFCCLFTSIFAQPYSKPLGNCSDAYKPVHTKNGENYLNKCVAKHFTEAKLFDGNYSKKENDKTDPVYESIQELQNPNSVTYNVATLPIQEVCDPQFPPSTVVMLKDREGNLVADGTLLFGHIKGRGVWKKPCYSKCLPPETSIYTPNGPTTVAELKIGDIIYTTNKLGQRVEAPIINKDSVKVTADHQLIDIILEDGRRIKCTPDHPNRDYSLMSSLRIGHYLEGSEIIEISYENYTQPYTFDILPAGETGIYWANGIRLGSTLFVEQLSANK